jgi:uncharacterized protein (DUF1499 family)
MGASVTRTSSFTFTPPAVFGAVHKALASIATVQQVDAERLYVAATRKASLSSWGERIQVWVKPESVGTLVTVESRCRLGTQVIDWGRNRRNVNQLLKATSERLQRGEQPEINLTAL